MKIIVGAVISLPPVSAGCAWNRLQYVLGLRRLGHEVVFVEQVEPDWSVDAGGRKCAYADSHNQRAFREIMRRFDLTRHCCQVFDAGKATCSMSADALRDFAADADLLIDISGHITTGFILDSVRRRAYLDQDPVYTQLWRAEYGKDLNLDRYDVFFTVGLNIGTPFSPMPDCGIRWNHTLPPVVLDLWQHANVPNSHGRFTTVASLYGYSDLLFEGEWYRAKHEEFRRFAQLPQRVNSEFELLLKDFRDDDKCVQLLRAGGWRVCKSADAASDLFAYRDYVAGSRAEIGITKGAYVKGRSGWFSDRTASYLASGRPAIAHSTGFERHLPVGSGLLCFHDIDEAVAAVNSVNANYEAHCRAAREVAAEYLDFRKVLPAMLDACTATAPPVARTVEA
jgi:hypothetical protein